jgi:hypothetical protein
MTIGKEIPFRRSKREHDTGSLVFDQGRKAAHESETDEAQSEEGEPKPKRPAAPH